MKPDELARRLKDQPFENVREPLMQKIVHAALATSMKRTPVRFGTLKRSETTRVEPGGLRGWVGTNVKYAPFVHDGTRYMKARPFFAEGIQDARPTIEKLLAQAGEDYLKAVVS